MTPAVPLASWYTVFHSWQAVHWHRMSPSSANFEIMCLQGVVRTNGGHDVPFQSLMRNVEDGYQVDSQDSAVSIVSRVFEH